MFEKLHLCVFEPNMWSNNCLLLFSCASKFSFVLTLFSLLSLVFIVIATWQSGKKVAANYGLPYILKFRICLWNLDMYVGFNKWDRLCTRNMQFLMPIIYDGHLQPSIRCVSIWGYIHYIHCDAPRWSNQAPSFLGKLLCLCAAWLEWHHRSRNFKWFLFYLNWSTLKNACISSS
jgi:hypothetical protein